MLSRSERDVCWDRLCEAFPRVPADLALEDGSAPGPDMMHGTSLLTCVCSADGHEILAAGGGRLPGVDSSIRVFDRASGAERLVCRGHVCGIYRLAVDPRTGIVASASEDYSVILWNLEKRDAIFLAGGPPVVKGHVAFASDRGRIAIGETEAYEGRANSAFVIDLDAGKEIFRLKLRRSKEVAGLALSADGSTLIVALANHQQRPQGVEVISYDVTPARRFFGLLSSTKKHWTYKTKEMNIYQLLWVPGKQLLVAEIGFLLEDSFSGACLFDADSGLPLAKRTTKGIGAAVAVSPDGQTVALAVEKGPIELLRAADLTLMKTIAGSDGKRFSALQFSPDGNSLLGGATLHPAKGGPRGQVMLFDLAGAGH